MLSRHAGPGDALILVHHLLTDHRRRPRVVMKAALQLDPCIDIVANRMPNAFVSPGGRAAEDIGRLAAGLGPRDALVLFPEGGNFTPERRRRAIRRLTRLRRAREAERAARMRNLMPPRPGGVLAALESAPTADVVFVAHIGLDHMAGAGRRLAARPAHPRRPRPLVADPRRGRPPRPRRPHRLALRAVGAHRLLDQRTPGTRPRVTSWDPWATRGACGSTSGSGPCAC